MAKTDTKKPKRRTSSTEVLRAPPINSAGKLAAQTSGALQQVANSVVPNPAKLLSGDIDTLPIGDWLLGDTTGMLDRWSKGRAPVTFPAYGSKLVNAKFDPAIIDALSVVAPSAKPLMKVGIPLAKAGAKSLVPDIASMAEHYALPMRAYAVPPEEGRAAFLALKAKQLDPQKEIIDAIKAADLQAHLDAGRSLKTYWPSEGLQAKMDAAISNINQVAAKDIEAHPFIGYLSKDGKMEKFNELQAKDADYHHSFLVKDLDAYDSDDALKFVRMGGENKYTIRGNAAITPHATESKAQISALAQRLINEGADNNAPFIIENMSLPKTEAPYQNKSIGTLKDWIEGTHDFAGGGIVKAAGKGLRGLAEKYRLAHEIAQKNAALPVSKGGLGLPPDNTALDRAKALGFDIYNKYFHGTGDDFTEFDPNSFFTTKPESASTYALDRGDTYAIDIDGNPVKAANVMPVYVKAKKYADDDAVISAAKKTKVYDPEIEDSYYYTSPNYDNFSAKAAPLVIKELKKKGFDAAEHYDFDMDGNEIISSQFFDPSQIRSTSAAFDPFRRGEADILAGVGIGLPVTGVVNRQEPVKKAKGGVIDYDAIYEFRDYGNRETGEAKDTGALGEIRMPNGRDVMTEYSINVDGREMPSIVEGMHPADLNYIRETGIVPRDAQATAIRSANKREAQGLSPFWNKEANYAHGGEVDYDKHYEFVQHTPISSTIDHDAMYMFRDDVQGFAKGGPVLSVGRGEKLPVAQGAGLTAKGRAKYNSATGGNLKAPAPHPKTEKDANRRKLFCARMSGMPGPMKDENGNPTRKAASLKRWNC